MYDDEELLITFLLRFFYLYLMPLLDTNMEIECAHTHVYETLLHRTLMKPESLFKLKILYILSLLEYVFTFISKLKFHIQIQKNV